MAEELRPSTRTGVRSDRLLFEAMALLAVAVVLAFSLAACWRYL